MNELSNMHTFSPPKDMLIEEGLLAFLMVTKELPSCMDYWKAHMNIKGLNNMDEALLWEAGLVSMEKITSISDDDRMTLQF
jgi:hypothetical protein